MSRTKPTGKQRVMHYIAWEGAREKLAYIERLAATALSANPTDSESSSKPRQMGD